MLFCSSKVTCCCSHHSLQELWVISKLWDVIHSRSESPGKLLNYVCDVKLAWRNPVSVPVSQMYWSDKVKWHADPGACSSPWTTEITVNKKGTFPHACITCMSFCFMSDTSRQLLCNKNKVQHQYFPIFIPIFPSTNTNLWSRLHWCA